MCVQEESLFVALPRARAAYCCCTTFIQQHDRRGVILLWCQWDTPFIYRDHTTPAFATNHVVVTTPCLTACPARLCHVISRRASARVLAAGVAHRAQARVLRALLSRVLACQCRRYQPGAAPSAPPAGDRGTRAPPGAWGGSRWPRLRGQPGGTGRARWGRVGVSECPRGGVCGGSRGGPHLS